MAAKATATRSQLRQQASLATALLLLERRSQHALKAAAGLPAEHLVPLHASAEHVERAIRATTTRSIGQIRNAARRLAHQHWEAMTGLRPRDLGVPALAVDGPRAGDAANALARAWRKQVTEAEEAARTAAAGDAPYRAAAPPMIEATEAIAPNLERTAQTEEFHAWNEEVARLNTFAASLGGMVTETWVALLDACPRCWTRDGDIVVLPDRFDGNPPLHPRCQCWLFTVIEGLDEYRSQ